MPIPSFALVPLFMLWFGIGNLTTILIVFYAATFPMMFNTWSGVRSVNPLWLRAAGAMGADEHRLFWKVIIPGASPFIITGMRQAFLRAWIAVVGAEMIAASDWGLGWVIFDAKEFLNTDIMLASLVVIGVIGFVFERLVFGSLETHDRDAVGHDARGQRLARQGKQHGPYRNSRRLADLRHARRQGAGRQGCQSRLSSASEFLCIVGPSGCGKSTLLNIIAGFLSPAAGEIRIGGKKVDGHGMDRGVVFQDFAQLFPWRTALGNVAFGLEMKGVPKDERERIAREQLRLVKLEKFTGSYPHHLSGGMQQRVAIARALAYNPAVLLMDEPFAALDALTRDDMQRLLADVWRETRKTVIYVTHNVSEAVYLADRVIVMTPHPGTVKAEIRIPLPRPRDPLSVEFLDFQKELLRHLGHETAQRTGESQRQDNRIREDSHDDSERRNNPPSLSGGDRRRRTCGRSWRAARGGAGNSAAGLPDQHVGHADLLSAALRTAGKARRQIRGIRRAVRQPHDAADGGAPGRHGHLCRPVVRHRPRQRRPGRHRHDRICRQDRARDGAQGPQHHQGRAAQGPQGRPTRRARRPATSSSTRSRPRPA